MRTLKSQYSLSFQAALHAYQFVRLFLFPVHPLTCLGVERQFPAHFPKLASPLHVFLSPILLLILLRDPGSSCFVVGSVIGSIFTAVLATRVLVNSRVMASRERVNLQPIWVSPLPPRDCFPLEPSRQFKHLNVADDYYINVSLWPNNNVSGSTLATLKQVTDASQKLNPNGPVPISEGDARESTSPNGIVSRPIGELNALCIAEVL